MNDEVKTDVKPYQWKKGQSGNPAGRPKNSKNAISLVKLQVEGESRAQMQRDMPEVIGKIMELALKGDKEMLKLVYKSWVSGTVASDEEAPKEKIVIQIGKLEQPAGLVGKVISDQSHTEE